MRHPVKTRCVGRLVLLLVLSSALLCAQSFLNLNFEQSTGSLPTGWDFGGGNFFYEVDTGAAYASAQSLRISSITLDTTEYGYGYFALSAGPAIGQTFDLSGAIRTQGVNGYASLWTSVADSQGNALAFQDLNPAAPTGTTSWQMYKLSVNVPAGAATITVGVILRVDATITIQR
jgi:hypothetical protein